MCFSGWLCSSYIVHCCPSIVVQLDTLEIHVRPRCHWLLKTHQVDKGAVTAIVGYSKLCDTTLLTIKLSLAKRNVGIIMTVIIIIAIAVGIVIYVLWSKIKKTESYTFISWQNANLKMVNIKDAAKFDVRTLSVCLSDQLLACFDKIM